MPNYRCPNGHTSGFVQQYRNVFVLWSIIVYHEYANIGDDGEPADFNVGGPCKVSEPIGDVICRECDAVATLHTGDV